MFDKFKKALRKQLCKRPLVIPPSCRSVEHVLWDADATHEQNLLSEINIYHTGGIDGEPLTALHVVRRWFRLVNPSKYHWGENN